MTITLTIVKEDNTHDMKAIKYTLKKYIKEDENNYITFSLRPHTMILKISITYNSYKYYFDIISALISSSNYYIQGIGLCLINIIKKSNEGVIEDHKKGYKISYKIINDNKEINSNGFILFPIKVYIYKRIELQTMYSYNTRDDLANKLSVSYDYENKEFEIKENKSIIECSEKFKSFLIYLLLNYNNGVFNDNKFANEYIKLNSELIDEKLKMDKNHSYIIKCTYIANDKD